ncbi:helix-turn-helix domain-containing protein [Marinomonas posidonica]|uniref:helix-turn-helix domain-containing protein n=1 Tax=Marinomonas posidonica TaxID=936476 RepID=UPI003735D3E0
MINELSYSYIPPNDLRVTPYSFTSQRYQNYPILGHSDAIIRVKKQIEFASRLPFAIFLSGENGCEKTAAAWHIHHLSKKQKGKFICVPANLIDAISYKEHLLKSMQLAKEGTLYIEDIDYLSDANKDVLISLFSDDDFFMGLKQNQIHLIISCAKMDLSCQPQQWMNEIFGVTTPQFNFHLPPLRERPEDIQEHIGFILSSLELNLDITDSALSLLKQYDWPGNIVELHRLILFLASCCDAKITAKDILDLGIIDITSPPFKDELIDRLLSHQLDGYDHLHPSIQKALNFLSLNFLDEVCLEGVAAAAFTSPSHLSFLFREHLSLSFKPLLNQMRIEFAKRKIAEYPNHSITDICLQSGFGDLSHFEKMFKRYSGCTPREYRNQQRKKRKHAYAS